MNPYIEIGKSKIGKDFPAYFIADVGANHDGSIERAKKLIALAKECGANAVKFQHFKAEKIVSDYGFKNLGNMQSHQKEWKKSVYEVYKDASLLEEWTPILKEESDKYNIDFFSSPYDLDVVEHLNPYVAAFKIGSGDINWGDLLIKVAKLNKPIIVASGASNILEVQKAIQLIKQYNKQVVLLQCNTNYTGSMENLKYVNLRVLKTYQAMFPDLVVGLSDHTYSSVTAVGTVALGGSVVEKHFTDDNSRIGPDHLFAMNPTNWQEMVKQVRCLEMALGVSIKQVEDNEKETIVLQRRAIRAAQDIMPGEVLSESNVIFLRPAPIGSFVPDDLNIIKGKKIGRAIKAGDYIRKEHIIWS